jgi:hypothetical protein
MAIDFSSPGEFRSLGVKHGPPARLEAEESASGIGAQALGTWHYFRKSPAILP